MSWLRRFERWWPGRSFAGGYPCCCGGGGGSSDDAGSESSSESALVTTSCTECSGDVASAWYLVQISGVTPDFGFCPEANCSSVDGMYVLGPVEQAALPGQTLCLAGDPFTGVCLIDESCFRFVQIVFIRETTGPLANHYLLLVELVSDADCNEELGLPTMRFVHDFGLTRPDCIDSFPLTINGGTVEYLTSPKCSAASATCTISAIGPP